MTLRGHFYTLFAVAGFFLATVAVAQNSPQTELERRALQFSNSVMSPYCPGRTLEACPSDDARKLRAQIKDRLIAGESEEIVRRDLVGSFGPDILGTPESSGFGIVGWGGPIIAVLAGLGFLGLFLVYSRGRGAGAAEIAVPDGEVVLSPDEHRLEEELKQRLKSH